MSKGKIRRALSLWVWGWPALVLFPPLGILWLLCWSIWIAAKWVEARKEFRLAANRNPWGMHIHAAAPAQRMILHDGHLMTPAQAIQWESRGGFQPHLSSRGATGAFQFIDDDWARINQQAAYRARMRHAEETGEIR